MNKIKEKIIEYKNQDIFIVFFSRDCIYSLKILDFLDNHNIKYKGYDIDNIKGGFKRVLRDLKRSSKITGFKETHKTKPIIFYKGKFIGGHDDTIKYIEKNII